MIDRARIEGFEWDDGNRRKNVDKYSVGQTEAEEVFFNEPLLVVEDVQHSGREMRFHALGHTDARRLLHLTFTLRHDDRPIRVISARPMHRKERFRYDQER